jgi:membrane associated rhomboid family serine protease
VSPWVKRILIANVVVFGVQQLAPFSLDLLVFVPRFVFTRPWTIVTYMFLHGGLGHLFFNMLAMFFFGSRVEMRIGARHFLQLYFIAGVSGALLSMVMAPMASIIGASAGVFGVMLAFATYWPRERIYIWGVIPVEAWLLVLLATLFSLYSGFGGSRGGVADFAHLGGFVGAFIYLWVMNRYSAANRFKARVSSVPPRTERALKENWRNMDLSGVHELSRQDVNRILDKISAEGIGSLTPQEKQFLSNFVPPDDRKSWTQ